MAGIAIMKKPKSIASIVGIHLQSNSNLKLFALPVFMLVASTLHADDHSSDFNIEIGASLQKSLISIEPGFSANARMIWKGVWLDVEYQNLRGLDYEIEGLQVIHDADNVIGKLGYEWEFEDNLHISPFFGVATNIEAATGTAGLVDEEVLIYPADEIAYTGGIEIGIMLTRQFKLSFTGSYLSAFGENDGQGLIGFRLSWRPDFGGGSRVAASEIIDNRRNDFEDFNRPEPETSDISIPVIEEATVTAPEPEISTAPATTSPATINLPVADPEAFAESDTPKVNTPAEIDLQDKPAANTQPFVKPQKPTSAPKPAVSGPIPSEIDGTRVLSPSEVTFQYGIQVGFFPDETYTARMLKQISERFDMSTVFVVKYTDGYRVFYEGFQDLPSAKEVLITIREEYSDAFVKRF